MKTDKEIIEEVLKSFENKKGWSEIVDGALRNEYMLKSDVEWAIEKALSMKDNSCCPQIKPKNPKVEKSVISSRISARVNSSSRCEDKTADILKTLKDLRGWAIVEKGKKNIECADREELKAEAIKWVKWLNTLQGEGDYTDNELECMKKVLFDFFNIMEGDI